MSEGRWLWLRWSWRDLRHHWIAVIAIALVLAIGIGVFAGLGSTGTWRRESNDGSFAALKMHDLRVTLSPGTFASEGALLDAASGIDSASLIVGTEERLVVDSQIDVVTPSGPALVSARLVGMTLDGDAVDGDAVDGGAVDGGAAVDSVWVRDGRLPVESERAAVLEVKFADRRDLEATGSLIVAGGESLDWVGLGATPEDFYYQGPEGTLLAQGELAPIYVSRSVAQEVIGRPGAVNDLVLRLAGGLDSNEAERDLVAGELSTAMAAEGISATISTRDDSDAFRVLYEDIDNDQRFWNMLAGLVLGAAALSAFNLINRIVEAQRREIGIGMALGVPRRRLAIRPFLVGLQIAILGTLAGVGVGYVVGQAMGDLIESFLPLPVQRTPFQFAIYAQAAALGIVVPLVACAIPVWRAVRVEPIDAIRTGHLAAKSSRFTDWTRRFRLPGSSLTNMPVRNVLRTPRRTILTALGVGAAITALVAVLAMLDSFRLSIETANDEFTKGNPERVLVQLDTFHPIDDGLVALVGSQPAISSTDAGIRLPVLALDDDDDLELLVELVDFENAAWTPTVDESAVDPTTGIVIAQKAAADLGLSVGDEMTIRHPARTELGSFGLVESTVPVAGVHVNPMRAFAFLDLSHADRFGLVGATNFLHAYPSETASRTDVQRQLFDLDGVISTQAVARLGESFEEALDQFTGFLLITATAVLILALLIAFNAARITVEERRREHATMQAYGLPVRSVLGVVVKESVLVGAGATVIGVAAGTVFLGVMLRSLATTTLPDLQIDSYLSPTTLAVAVVVGIVAVAVAPLFLVPRIRRMSIPDTLRVME